MTPTAEPVMSPIESTNPSLSRIASDSSLRTAILALILLTVVGCATTPAANVDDRVAALLRDTPLIDGHNDLMIHFRACKVGCPRELEAYDIAGTVKGHSDLARWEQGGLGAQLMNSGWVESEGDLAGTLKGFAFTRDMAARYSDRLAMARTGADIRAVHASGRIALVLALENPGRLGSDEATVRRLASEGLRSNILAYNKPTALGDGHAGPATHGGLSPLGEQMVGWMQQNGILVDLSHASAGAARDVLDHSVAPVIFSHSSTTALCDVSRNVPDDVLRRLPANGGIAMVSFVPEFTRKEFSDWYDRGDVYWAQLQKAYPGEEETMGALMDAWEKANPKPVVGVADVADHVEHVRNVAGIDHVGIGADYDGIQFTPQGLEDVSTYPNLLAELARRGWTDAELRKLAGENFLRVLDAAEAVAAKAASERAP